MKHTAIRPKLSPRQINLPSGYHTTAYAIVRQPAVNGRGQRLEIARFHSSTPGQVEVFAAQGEGGPFEISPSEFKRLLIADLS